jgi:hypothetical protein
MYGRKIGRSSANCLISIKYRFMNGSLHKERETAFWEIIHGHAVSSLHDVKWVDPD